MELVALNIKNVIRIHKAGCTDTTKLVKAGKLQESDLQSFEATDQTSTIIWVWGNELAADPTEDMWSYCIAQTKFLGCGPNTLPEGDGFKGYLESLRSTETPAEVTMSVESGSAQSEPVSTGTWTQLSESAAAAVRANPQAMAALAKAKQVGTDNTMADFAETSSDFAEAEPQQSEATVPEVIEAPVAEVNIPEVVVAPMAEDVEPEPEPQYTALSSTEAKQGWTISDVAVGSGMWTITAWDVDGNKLLFPASSVLPANARGSSSVSKFNEVNFSSENQLRSFLARNQTTGLTAEGAKRKIHALHVVRSSDPQKVAIIPPSVRHGAAI